MKQIKNVLIIQSGGPTAVINSSLIGLVFAIKENPNIQIFGSKNGIVGLLKKSLINLNKFTDQQLNRIKVTPGAFLGTCRFKVLDEHYDIIIQNLKSLKIDALFIIGGNGSMYLTHRISQSAQESGYNLKVIGIPKSIDNDVNNIDHSPGYISAAKFLISCSKNIYYDISSYDHPKKVTIFETMGRNTGWLAAACMSANIDDTNYKQLIYIPEIEFNLDECIQKISSNHDKEKHVTIIMSEGIQSDELTKKYSTGLSFDPLDRPIFGGISTMLKQEIQYQLGLSAHVINTSIWQRCGQEHVSEIDLQEAFNLGCYAWETVLDGGNNSMVTLYRSTSTPYNVYFDTISLDLVSGIEKSIPQHWYDTENHTLRTSFINYLEPLIQ